MDDSRISFSNTKSIAPGPVVYWMQGAVRLKDNPALNYALSQAWELKRPFGIFFGLDYNFPEANVRSFTFLLQGLQDVAEEFKSLGLKFFLLEGSGPDLLHLVKNNLGLVVTDQGVLAIQREWRLRVSQTLDCRFVEVETETTVPIKKVSDKAQWSAATLRRRLVPLLPFYGDPELLPQLPVEELKVPKPWEHKVLSMEQAFEKLDKWKDSIPRSVPFRGGEKSALKNLELFSETKLEGYDRNRNDPTIQGTSRLSPFLHFGHISPRTIRSRVLQEPQGPDTEAFLEELIVRRELSFNYCYFNPQAGTYEGLPTWALKTLEDQRSVPRDYLYTLEEWEKGETHDPSWNAAQRELVLSGFMSGYMRMYWGKKILEWSASPSEAFSTALYLNNKYALDGRDPNSIAGVAWCFGLHDRPWAHRKVFGMVRYMNSNGLKRKFNLEAYIKE